MNWIPIYMRLPEEGKYVLITDGKTVSTACYYYHPQAPVAYEWVDKQDQIINQAVIWWFPIPDLPIG